MIGKIDLLQFTSTDKCIGFSIIWGKFARDLALLIFPVRSKYKKSPLSKKNYQDLPTQCLLK